MGNAMAQSGTLGLVSASQQGIVGLRLQNALPQARVVYVSATGATKVSNLSYANPWGFGRLEISRLPPVRILWNPLRAVVSPRWKS
ncbi:strawberry notch family protein (plasmid) [Nostoc sp. UHCC 0926]|uniref:strawberry notch-like NTP hydrolase domain-containing protein n=1 Tax=Nostoc sp. UHCC 0926 TaxID=3025190 RepID=UPI002361EEAC|nr:strawberry notch family protein [Nostoc sp. UHCC 0926]WDD36728.1 strawberry notch family protein [Nostoc sp. UHCC 0926]